MAKEPGVHPWLLCFRTPWLDTYRRPPRCPSLPGHCHANSWIHLRGSFTTCLPRNLWQEVTHYLRLGDIDAATEQKRRLEEKQRMEERKRETLRTPWRPKYFIPEVTILLLGSGPE